jgi:osmoprotectant transport system ATP-binding protein
VHQQFASPGELLMHPASQFVEDFVGSDRALKRLALQRVRDIDLWKAAAVRAGESTAEARAKIADSDLSMALLVDDDHRPIGWLSDGALAGERVERKLRSEAKPTVELDDILRDALADLLSSDSRYGPVVDGNGHLAGVLSLEVIGNFLQQAPVEARTGAELVAEAGE